MFDTKKIWRGLPGNGQLRKRLLGNILNGMVLLLLSVSVAACGTFVGVEGVTKTPVELSPYLPPRPAPVLPLNLNLNLPQVWEQTDPTRQVICLPIQESLDLASWVKTVSKNQREWSAYADYWETRK